VSRKSIKKADAKEVAKVAVNVDLIESDPEESALMEIINAADLKQKLAQNINLFMKNNTKHLEVHV
jgi:hypothetical protein